LSAGPAHLDPRAASAVFAPMTFVTRESFARRSGRSHESETERDTNPN